MRSNLRMQFDALDGQGPLYRQLYRSLRSAILDGRMGAGMRLPSTREMGTNTGVARNRVVLAYAQLVDEGYAVARVGSGTYVASELPATERAGSLAAVVAASPPAVRLARATRRLVARGAGWTAIKPGLRWDFSCGRPSWRDFPHAVWARLVRRRARLTSAVDLDYAPSAGVPELRGAIAEHLTRWRGLACRPEQIIVTSGSQQALRLVADLLLDPGDVVALEEPHYAGARQAFELARARLAPIRVDEQGIDVARLVAAGRVTPRLAYVTPAHQFPTGAVLPLARRLALLAWARRAGAYVVEDDYDSEYRYAGTPIETLYGLDGAERVFHVGSFSKILSPALRLGYLVVPASLTRTFTIAKTAADLGCASFGQRVLADFIAGGHLEVHLRRSRRRHASRRTALLAAIAEHLSDRVEVRGAAAGLHVMLVPQRAACADVERMVRRAAAHDVGIYSTTALHLRRPRRSAWVLGHGALSERDIATGIARLADVIAGAARV